MSEITYAVSLVNPKIRSYLMPYIDLVPWQSSIARQIISYFKENDVSGRPVSPGEIRGCLANIGVEDEVDGVVAQSLEFLNIDDDALPTFVKGFEEFFNTKHLTEYVRVWTSEGEATKIISGIKGLQEISTASIPIYNMSDLDIDEVQQQELGGMDVLPTSFDFITRATGLKGYMRSQVVMVVAAPGVGKSLFLANEVMEMLKQGYRVYWLALGDMLRMDFISRFSALYHRTDLATVQFEAKKYYTDEVRKLLANLRISCVPAGVIDSYEMKSHLDTVAAEEDFDCFVLDYDANLKSRTDNMYEEGDITYNMLSSIARPKNSTYRLVLVASQPKIQEWGKSELPKESAAESSRKQAIVDMMITIGRSPDVKIAHAGIMKVAKIRRGKEGESIFYKLTDHGSFNEISLGDYERMKTRNGNAYKDTYKKFGQGRGQVGYQFRT